MNEASLTMGGKGKDKNARKKDNALGIDYKSLILVLNEKEEEY